MMDLQRLMAALGFSIIGWTQGHLWLKFWEAGTFFPEGSKCGEQAEDLIIRGLWASGCKGRRRRKLIKTLKWIRTVSMHMNFWGTKKKYRKGNPLFWKRHRHWKKKFGGEYLKIHKGARFGSFTRPGLLCAACKLYRLPLHHWQGKRVWLFWKKWSN